MRCYPVAISIIQNRIDASHTGILLLAVSLTRYNNTFFERTTPLSNKACMFSSCCLGGRLRGIDIETSTNRIKMLHNNTSPRFEVDDWDLTDFCFNLNQTIT